MLLTKIHFKYKGTGRLKVGRWMGYVMEIYHANGKHVKA